MQKAEWDSALAGNPEFEPSDVFAKLKENSATDKKWLCYDYALGDKNEQKVINVYKSTVFSSFLTANDYSKNIWHSLEDVTPETVEVRRLSDIWSEVTGSSGCKNYMLKLDTQGRIALVNRYACDVLGWTADELLGRNWADTCRNRQYTICSRPIDALLP